MQTFALEVIVSIMIAFNELLKTLRYAVKNKMIETLIPFLVFYI